jgi:hypothetical protein
MYSDAAPTGLGIFMRVRGYKDVAPTVLAEQRRIVAELDALLPAIQIVCSRENYGDRIYRINKMADSARCRNEA